MAFGQYRYDLYRHANIPGLALNRCLPSVVQCRNRYVSALDHIEFSAKCLAENELTQGFCMNHYILQSNQENYLCYRFALN